MKSKAVEGLEVGVVLSISFRSNYVLMFFKGHPMSES